MASTEAALAVGVMTVPHASMRLPQPLRHVAGRAIDGYEQEFMPFWGVWSVLRIVYMCGIGCRFWRAALGQGWLRLT